MEMNTVEMENNGGHHMSGLFYTTMMCECTAYLPWLMNRY
jgi:hypothetical protein